MHAIPLSRADVGAAAELPAAGFVVGEWLVEPELGRISRNGMSVHVRPKLMDLLAYLACNTGRTVPHGELLAHVWPDQPFLASTVLPRSIAELRHALGDRAAGPTVIQTIPKRGYRLIALVRRAGDGLPPVMSPSPPTIAAPDAGAWPRGVAASSKRHPARGLRACLVRARRFLARIWPAVRSRAG